MTKKTNGATRSPPLPVRLVKRDKVFYPKTEDDYKALLRSDIPLSSITEDFVPLLNHKCKGKFTFNISDFNELELRMFEKVQAKWPFEAKLTKTNLVFKAPKRVKQDRVDSMVQAIKAWYQKHWIILDADERKTSKAKIFTLTKRDTYASF